MNPKNFFLQPSTIAQKQYEALRMFFVGNVPAKEVADKFRYTYRGFTTIVSDFRKRLKSQAPETLFFQELKKGRKRPDYISGVENIVIQLRKQYYSVGDIKVVLDGKGYQVSERTIYNIISEEGFSRLPRRFKSTKLKLEKPNIIAPKSRTINFDTEDFKSSSVGILCLLPKDMA